MLKMLTLSRQNHPNLEQGLDILIQSFRRLRHSKFWKKYVDGGVMVIEITGEPGNWHPHIHCFIYSKRISWDEILKHWKKASKGGCGVYIKNVSHHGAIHYVTKYVTKANTDNEFSDIFEMAMKGRRTFQRFGSFQKIKMVKYYSHRVCENCGCNEWLTEWDINKTEIQMRRCRSR
jgi:hypothetical protein